MDKISVIIPCYNSERHIKKCLDSVLSQTYSNLEIIAIDDGSTDNTVAILEEYAKADERIALLQQQHTGAGAASNKGIEFAGGELLAFVDHDDFLAPYMYERLHEAMIRDNADIAVCNFNMVYDNRIEERYSNTNSRDAVVDVHDDVYAYFTRYCACPKPNNYTWSRLYKTHIVKKSNIRFEELLLGADTLFNFKLLPLMKRITFIQDGLYNYVQHGGSIIHSAAKKNNLVDVYIDGFERLADYYKSKGFDEFLKVLPIHAFTRLRSIFFYSRLAGMSDDAIIKDITSKFVGRKIYDYLTGVL